MDEQAVNNPGGKSVRSTSRLLKSPCRTQREVQRRCRQPRRPRRDQSSQNVSPAVKAWMDNVIIPILLQKLRNEVEVEKAA